MKENLAERSLKNLKTKKISLNLDMDSLEFIEELSKILNATKTTVILSLIGSGMKSFLALLETSWTKMKSEKTGDSIKIDKFLKQITELRRKYNLN